MDRLVYDRMDALEEAHWWFAARRDIIAKIIGRLAKLPARPRILEAGCGTGGNLALLSSFGEVDAFEYDAEAASRAERKSGLSVPFGALPDQIPHGDTSYDLIGLFDVLEHVEDHVGTLRALGGRLGPNGRVIVTVPALPWLWSKHDERHHHFRRYTRRSLRKAAEEAGLQVDRSFYFNSFLLPVAMGLRAAKAALGKDAPDDTMPSSRLNRALYNVFSSERHLIGRVSLPVGLSVCAVLKRGDAS